LLAADGVALTVWQTDTGQPLPGFQPVVNGAHSFAFAPDAKSVAVASPRLLNGDDAVHLVDLTTGRELRKFTVSAALVNSLAFSPDGRLLAAGAVDGITIWDVATGQTLINPKGHLGAVMSVVFTVDGTLLASASADGTIRLWGVP
jgi:WD40 repeat protein